MEDFPVQDIIPVTSFETMPIASLIRNLKEYVQVPVKNLSLNKKTRNSKIYKNNHIVVRVGQ